LGGGLAKILRDQAVWAIGEILVETLGQPLERAELILVEWRRVLLLQPFQRAAQRTGEV
jgi:hypothetical protein